jgi:hypothetical protein
MEEAMEEAMEAAIEAASGWARSMGRRSYGSRRAGGRGAERAIEVAGCEHRVEKHNARREAGRCEWIV